MHDRKSLYSRNKRNSRAILCPDAFEQDLSLIHITEPTRP